MKPKVIGLIGGAGPLAGAALLDRIFTLSGGVYGCYRDADFPKVILISYPFSEMLTPKMDAATIRKELKECLRDLESYGASVLAIACNTLHAFLEGDNPGLIHLPKVVAQDIPKGNLPLVLCTATSRKFALHKRFFPCVYPKEEIQEQIDHVIDLILKGESRRLILIQLDKILEGERGCTLLLGCTELSLYAKDLAEKGWSVVDPLEILAKKILEKSFSKQ